MAKYAFIIAIQRPTAYPTEKAAQEAADKILTRIKTQLPKDAQVEVSISGVG